MVTRYKQTGYDRGLEPAHDGSLVSFSDFARLEAENRDLRAKLETVEAESKEHLRGKNALVLAAYPAMDAVDAIRAWCDTQPYENDVITVSRLRSMLPPLKDKDQQNG